VPLRAKGLGGVGLLGTEEKVVSVDKYCSECGAELPPSGDFCTKCGARKVPTKTQPKAAAPAGRVSQKRETIVPGAGIAGFIFAIVGLIFVFMPFYALTETMTYGTGLSLTFSVSGFDLARGVITLYGYSVPFMASYPVIWLVVLGAVLALVFGLLGCVTSVSTSGFSDQRAKLFWVLTAVSGIMIVIGAIVAAIQILGISTSYSDTVNVTGYGNVTYSISSYVGFGVFGEVVIGSIIMTLGLVAAAKTPKGHK
jgi:ribosomal protein L40E